MSEPVQKTNIVADGLSIVIQQYKGLPNITALITAVLNRAQELENRRYAIYTSRMFSTAANAQLDTIGKLIGATRNSASDTMYRLAIGIQIWVNGSNGRVNDLIYTLVLCNGYGLTTTYFEYYPAAFEVEQTSIYDAFGTDATMKAVAKNRPAGVRGAYKYFVNSLSTQKVFTFTATVADTTTNDTGFGYVGNLLATPGGQLSSQENL